MINLFVLVKFDLVQLVTKVKGLLDSISQFMQVNGTGADFPTRIVNYFGIWGRVNDRLETNDWGSI